MESFVQLKPWLALLRENSGTMMVQKSVRFHKPRPYVRNLIIILDGSHNFGL